MLLSLMGDGIRYVPPFILIDPNLSEIGFVFHTICMIVEGSKNLIEFYKFKAP
jgi:hypothetical protein